MCSPPPRHGHFITFNVEKHEDTNIICTFARESNTIDVMTTIVLQVQDENLVSKVKQACKMLMGVVSVKVQKSTPKVDDITKTAHYKAAMDDVKKGRVYHADSVDDMFKQILG